MLEIDDIYRDQEGRQFRLVQRVNPRGPIPAFWSVYHLGTGRSTTIREDRLLSSDYEQL